MIVCAHQPAYLPWLGYFDKIAAADVFVFLDTVQFEKNSFINRNRIKTAQGPQWLTVPVLTRGHLDGSLRDTLIDERQPWRGKHLKSIAMNYARAPHFDAGFEAVSALIDEPLEAPQDHLAELCWQQLQFWLAALRIDTRVVRLSELGIDSRKSDLVLDLCLATGADRYLSGALGRDYLEVERFHAAGVDVEFQSYDHPVYPQCWGEFAPAMSVVDAWLNCGADATADLLQVCAHA